MNIEIPILKIALQNEMDVMLGQRRTMQFAGYCGISTSEQTRFSTSVSEICRNALEYARSSSIEFSIKKTDKNCSLLVKIEDKGKGIENIEEILARNPKNYKGRGLGIVYARKLADNLDIVTNANGTTVYIQKKLTSDNRAISKETIDGWLKRLNSEPVISPYEELKIRNIQLVDLTDKLQANVKIAKKQMEEINLLNEKLFKANDRMKEFTFAISHDLKNPLTSIKLASECLSPHCSDNEAAEYHQILSRSISRFERIINSLVELLNIQNQEKQISRQLNFNVIFLHSKEEYADMIKATKAVFKTDFSSASQIMYIEGYLESIFRNLISNSLKYKDPKRAPLINISTAKTKNGVVLTYSDNGMGMDLDKIKHKLFTPFSRFSDLPEGKGIGLYLIKGMVEDNGGTVSINSKEGEGTSFIFHLNQYS